MTVGLKVGPMVGPQVGPVPRPASVSSWSTDATSGYALPADGTEAAALLAAASISATTLGMWIFGSAASGNITDASGNSKTLTKSVGSTVAYQQAVTGWTATATVFTANTEGMFSNNTFPNINATTPTLIMYGELVTEGALRTVMRYGDAYDDDCVMEQNTTPRILGGEGDATRTTGGSDPTGAVRPYAISCGASVILASDQESIAVGTKAANGTTVTFGGDNVTTNWPFVGKLVFGWLIDAALSSAQIKTLFQTAGWTIPW